MTSKTTDLRTELDYLRLHPELSAQDDFAVSAYAAAIERIKAIYRDEGTIAKTAKRLAIGKRTLERAMSAHPDLRYAIESVRE